nr:unnamed protein product [Callosobruchus chinensis]CAH7749486.1 unnamed protein product [Callosobruchus chinensis]
MGVPTDDAYTHPFLAWLLHNLPHYNVTFHLVNSTFEPHNPIYLESLGILASLPAACLILTLLLLLVYLLTRCCDRRPRPQRSISALKAVLAATAVACCACVGLGLYGNDDAHNGAVEALGQAAQVDQLVARVRNHTDDIERQLRVQAEIQIREIQNVFQVHTLNQSLFKQVDEYFKKLVDNRNLTANAARDIRQPLVGLNLTTTIAFGQKIESWRWPATMAVLSGFLVLLVVLLLGVARHNRFFLIVFSVCGLLAVIISYLMASVYLASSVALGDLCMAPDKFIEDQASSELSKEILKYYTNCERARANPFTQRLREAKTTLMNMRNNLNLMMKPAEYLYPKKGLDTKFSSLRNDINAADNLIHSLTALVDCRTLHMHYLRGARALCNVGLLGLALMLVSAVLSGFLLTILVWVDSHTWIYIRKKKDYQQVTESDPTYLPPSSAGSQAIAARTLQRSQGLARPPDTPPPSYASALLAVHAAAANSSAASAPPLPHEADLLLYDGCDQRSSGDHHHHHRGPPGGGGAHMAHLRGHTLGRLPSHHHDGATLHGPNNGKYATLSKQCKTLESSDFY